MSSMKRFPLVVLFLIVAALVMGTPALAGTSNVKLAPTGVEPSASGQARMEGSRFPWVPVRLSVNCKALQPGETYCFWASASGPGGSASWGWWYFTADATGSGTAGGEIYVEAGPIRMSVTNADGDDVLTGEL